jgi:ATP-dependent Zn protease
VTDGDFEQYAEAIRDLRISHEAGHAVVAEHLGYELRHLSVDAPIVSPEGTIGGWVDINFERLSLNDPEFDERLQEVATILMGGRAAEEMTHPELAKESHWKNDTSDFTERVRVARTDEEMGVLLEIGHQRATGLLNTSALHEEHNRLCVFLAKQPNLRYPNGRFLWRVMKGKSS